MRERSAAGVWAVRARAWPMLAALAWLVGGCSAPPRPDPGAWCPMLPSATGPGPAPVPPSPTGPRATTGAGTTSATAAAGPSLRRQIEHNFAERLAVKRAAARPTAPPPGRPVVTPAPTPAPSPEAYSVLVLSAGGQTGAYGAGFLKGWGDRGDLQPDRSQIDMITGVSTGAMMATFAYLGSSSNPRTRAQFDAALEAQYTELRDEDVFRKRGIVEMLWSNSVYDTQPLWTRIGELVSDALLDAVVAEADETRRLMFVGAVNADSGEFEVFDLVALARDRSPQRRACYTAAILASAAIPGAFEPVFINGRMYIDGGARRNVFFVQEVGAALPGVDKHLFGIMHADLSPSTQTTRNHLVGVVSRTASLAMDELVLDAAYRVDAEASRLGFATHWTSASQVSCPSGGGMFDPQKGRCLWATGLARARDAAQPWKAFSEIDRP